MSIKGKKWYNVNFEINIDYYNKTIYDSFFAYNDEDAINKLPEIIQKRIGFITTNIKNIILSKHHNEIRKFYNFEELYQESIKV